MGKIVAWRRGIVGLLGVGVFALTVTTFIPGLREQPLESYTGTISFVTYLGSPANETRFGIWLTESFLVSYALAGDRRSEIEVGRVYRVEIFKKAPLVRLVLLKDVPTGPAGSVERRP